MMTGIVYALAACLIWGLIFVVPGFMTGFTSIEIALGRYIVYGGLSSIIFLKSRLQGFCKYPAAIWLRAAGYSLVFTVGYYTCVVLSLRFSTPAICALILGLSPIVIAFYGNWKEKEVSYRSLFLPALMTLAGLILINVPHIQGVESPATYMWGLIFGALSLIGWSWYVVANSRFLKDNPQVNTSDWATLVGVTCLIWVAAFALFFGLFFPDQFSLQKCTTLGPDFTRFVIGSLILGVICAWFGSYFWNKASLRLPVSLAGQLTIFETIFGVIFFYMLEKQMPPLMECLGMMLFLCAIIFGVRQFSRTAAEI